MRHVWTEEERKAQSERMKELYRLGKLERHWSEERKENQRKKTKKWWDEHRDEYKKHKDITISQREDYAAYQREYQRKWREQHKDYYKELQKKRKKKESY